nr:ASCH domain-containing protein [Agrobacterium tumefaciens]
MLSGLVNKVLTGDKTSTIRFERGSVEYPSGIMLPLFEVTVPNRHENARLASDLQIVRVVYKSIAELDQHDVKKDGRASRDELLESMELFYGKMSADELVTIYEFKCHGPRN